MKCTLHSSRCGTFISVCNQPPRSTQPGYPFLESHNEYQPKGSDALQLGNKGMYGSCVAGKYNCDPLLHTGHILALYKFICLLTYLLNFVRYAPKIKVLTSTASSQKLTYGECSGSTMTMINITYHLTHFRIFDNSFQFENLSA